MSKRFTQQEMDILKANPYVKSVRENRLTLTYEFRVILWEEWVKEPSTTTIKSGLTQYNFDCSMLGGKLIRNLNVGFKRYGKPSRGTNKVFGVTSNTFKTDPEENKNLLSTGKFIKGRNGIAFHPAFINELYHAYPNQSIEEGLIKEGIDPQIVGYQRIYTLQTLFDDNGQAPINTSYDDKTIGAYKNHPYIKRITYKQFVLNDSFYNEGYVLSSLHIDEILATFEIDCTLLTITMKNNIKYKLQSWEKVMGKTTPSNNYELLLKIARNYKQRLEDVIQFNFEETKKMIPALQKQQRKALCQWIHQVPVDIQKVYTIKTLLRKIGISKSSYYSILKNNDYGNYEVKQTSQDEDDIEIIKTVMEYRGYPKGSRMIYMMMKGLTGIQFGRNKILRLMKKYQLTSGIRKANTSRRSSQELLKKNLKPNTLKRKFRLERPLTTLLTDVSYLKYSINTTAYLSTIKDGTSGKILVCVVREANNLQLVEDTLEQLKQYAFNEEALLHSDQGTLYLNSMYQNKVELMGFIQSMSRRGNCWDNSSQETYFGHFKDECHFKNCESIEALRVMVDEYVDYYNNERPQWTRMKMTPNQYEKYVLEMTDEEFKEYQDNEKKKYDIMMEEAREKAKKRAQDIGAI